MRPGRCTSWPAASRARWCLLRAARAGLPACRHPDWLFEECYQAVGDLAETIAHVLPDDGMPSIAGPGRLGADRLLPLRGLPEAEEVASVCDAYWRELDAQGRFLLIKLVGEAFASA
jgi:hypothetical protein